MTASLSITLIPNPYTIYSGGSIKFSVIVANTGDAAYNVKLWDTVPMKMSFPEDNTNNSSWTLNGQVFSFNAGTILPGEIKQYTFVLKTDDGLTDGTLIPVEGVTAGFSDAPSADPERRSISNSVIVSTGDIVVFPNPFNPKTAVNGLLKFANIPPEGIVNVFTVSGELVFRMPAVEPYVYWDGHNNYGGAVSPGIYYYVVTSPRYTFLKKGILYIVGK
jgi:uncharacterized repeat protein (TIGR01451 family)